MLAKIFKPVPVSDSKGAASLVTVIIVSVATLIMAVTASSLGLGELDLGYTSQQGAESFAMADGCMEETFRRIRLDTNYGVGQGTITLTTSNGSCTIDVSASGSNRTIVIKGTHDIYSAKIRAEISLSGNIITISSWSERSD